MVYIYGYSLPRKIQQEFNLQKEDIKNPQNYIPYVQIKEFVFKYNNDHVESDHLYLHEFCHDFIYASDLKQITELWNDDQRPESEKAEHQQRLTRIADRKYVIMTKDVNRSNQKSVLLGTDSIKNYEASMSFGLSFIFSIFASSLVGYYLGIYFFQTTHDKKYYQKQITKSLILAVFFLMGALILETILYILKIQKDESIQKLRKIYGTQNMNLGQNTNQNQQKMKKDKIEQNKKKKISSSDKLKSE